MKKLVLSAVMASAAFVLTPSAHAAQSINISPAAPDGSVAGSFHSDGLASGPFTNIFNFTLPIIGFAGVTISSIFAVNANNNIDFTSVTFNGTDLNIGSTGDVEFRYLNNLITHVGLQSLVVNGIGGGNGSYAGTISFSPGVVPEVSTWAMLLVGFGAIGVAMRRRPNSAVSFA